MGEKNIDWIKDLKSGSYEAFNSIYFEYSKRLYAFAKSYIRNDSDVEEIVQEVFLKLWKNRAELKEDLSFDSYLFTVTKNAVLNTLRSKKYKDIYLQHQSLFPSKNVLLDDELNFRELEKSYLFVVDSLPPRKKEVYLLSREKLLSYNEIAEELGISVKTVDNHMTSALSDIRKKISSLGFSGLLFVTLFI
ncbi:RNA polymerase sigma-70 factor [Prolixibacteraceae bacterium Z1-6]|uniref:RNA polymerase sigma-70 factor n=1 Tax=Draconibacterium aestuarii TaxID=2998507 RepID=A0A9X3F914_9BACT|nr:RNA polymerase sigma-70 factor [Prolixibacteraceae bacterium Z1-6]